MKLWKYIQGKRKGKDAHRLELESMKDPFLADALDGYDKVKGNHKKKIESLQRQIIIKSGKKLNISKPLSIAAGIIIILGIGTFLLTRESSLPEEINIAFQELHIKDSILLPPRPGILKNDVMARQERNKESGRTIVSQAESDNFSQLPDMDDFMDIEISQEMNLVATEDAGKQKTLAITEISKEESNNDTTPSVSIVAERSILTDSVNIPEYNDGVSKKEFNRYIKENLRKPTDEQCKDIKGKVKVGFYVHNNGRPYNITIKKSLCSSIDKEAIRLVSEGPNWSYTEKEIIIDIKF